MYLFFSGSSVLHGLFYSSTVWASRCGGFSCCTARPLGYMDFSSCGFQALEHRLNNCGTPCQLFHGMWDLLGSGIEPVSPALAVGFFTTESPGKPKELAFSFTDLIYFIYLCSDLHSFFPSPFLLRFNSSFYSYFRCKFQFSSVAQSCQTLCDSMNRSR